MPLEERKEEMKQPSCSSCLDEPLVATPRPFIYLLYVAQYMCNICSQSAVLLQVCPSQSCCELMDHVIEMTGC